MHGLRTCFEARKPRDGQAGPGSTIRRDTPQTRPARGHPRPAPAPPVIPRKELIYRLRKRRCELCEHGTTVAVHQVRGLASLGRPGPGQPAWAALMAEMRRKTLIVCVDCHDHIHANPVANTA